MFERESARLAHIWQSKKDSLNFTHGITNGELGLISVCIAFLRYFWEKHYGEKFRETSSTFPPSSWTSLTPYYNLISERWGLNLEERSEERSRGEDSRNEDSSEKLKKRKKKSRIVKIRKGTLVLRQTFVVPFHRYCRFNIKQRPDIQRVETNYASIESKKRCALGATCSSPCRKDHDL